jgi:hypothetical protein
MRRGLAAVVLALGIVSRAGAQEGVFLHENEAPAAVVPDAERSERLEFAVTPELRTRVEARLAGVTPSLWEERWIVFRAVRGDRTLGHALVVEEIGKHRPITFVVGVRPDGSVADVAVMAYREAYGGEIGSQRFLQQYRGKRPTDGIRPARDIMNVAGATLSVEAASRAVRKAQAIALGLGLATAP